MKLSSSEAKRFAECGTVIGSLPIGYLTKWWTYEPVMCYLDNAFKDGINKSMARTILLLYWLSYDFASVKRAKRLSNSFKLLPQKPFF